MVDVRGPHGQLIALTVDDAEVKRKFALLGESAADGRPALNAFFQYYRTVIGMMFQTAGRATGGSARGIGWRGFAPQYTRKTDGVTVPAWGGVKRVVKKYADRGRIDKRTGVLRIERMGRLGANVKGRLRPSGRRVTARSSLMRDTGQMFQQFTRRPLIFTRNQLRAGTVQPYAEYQNAMRPFAFFTGDDQTRFTGFVGAYLNELCRKHGLA